MRRFPGVLVACLSLAIGMAATPEQPLPFSHKTHITEGKLKCQDCHPNPAKFGEDMGFATTSTCMACHVAIAKDKPAIQKLTELAKAKQPIPWAKVYTLPDFVFFDHRFHLVNGAKCEDCHGQVAEQDVIANTLNSTKMTFCQTCHVKMKANSSCTACHNYR